MSSVNVAVLVGRLTRDPEMKYTPSGTALCQFSIAVDRAGDKNEESGEIESGFFDVQVWGNAAETCGQYLMKGRQVGVSGSLKHHRWEAADGTRRSKVEIRAYSVQFLGPKGEQTGEAHDDERDEAPAFAPPDEDIPFHHLDFPSEVDYAPAYVCKARPTSRVQLW